MDGFLRTLAGTPSQTPADVAVVLPTILRPSLSRALASVFAQDFPGRIHVLLGIDAPMGDPDEVAAACAHAPPEVCVQALYPGYSTSVRHGGLHPARDGGVLRSVLTYLANARCVAYLDDDNWWAPTHLRLLHAALQEAEWAYSLRMFVHPATLRPVCVDAWESVGPGRGVFAERMGGFADPNTLMIDKLACREAVPLWCIPLPGDAKAMSADRVVFELLRRRPGRGTDAPTAFYRLDPEDGMHPLRLKLMGDAYDKAGVPAPG